MQVFFGALYFSTRFARPAAKGYPLCMPTIELLRPSPLTRRERTLLPGGLDLIEDEPPVLARIQLHVPLPRFVEVAVALARAVPDAQIRVVEEPGTQGMGLPPSPVEEKKAEQRHAALVPPRRTFDDHGLDADDPNNPWSALDVSDIDRAAARFVGHSLDSNGRDRVRAMLQSTSPADIAAGCRIARVTQWRSMAQTIKKCVRHGDTRVRLEAVQALRELGGPGMAVAIRPLLTDSAPEVREAAEAALAAWG